MTSPFASRTELLLEQHGVNRLRNAHVLVVGLGGVGGHGAESCRQPSNNCWRQSYMPPLFGCSIAAEVIKTIPYRP